MPDSCCAPNCTNRKTPGDDLRFYKIPGLKRLQVRERWLQAIRRDNWSENQIKNAKICSAHFISGKYEICEYAQL